MKTLLAISAVALSACATTGAQTTYERQCTVHNRAVTYANTVTVQRYPTGEREFERKVVPGTTMMPTIVCR